MNVCSRWPWILVAALVLAGSERAGYAQPRFTRMTRLTNAETALTLSAPSNANYRIDVAENISSLTNGVGWHGLITVPPGPGTLQHTDTAAPYLGTRFYRAQQLVGATNLTGDHLTTTNGDAIIHPVNHASLVISWNGLMIYVDTVGSSTLYSGFRKADLILVTHSHSDHFSATTLDAVRGSGVIILAPQAVYNAMSATLKSFSGVMTNWATTNVLGMSIQAIPAYNSNHPLGSGNGYVVNMGGRRFLFSGDTGDIPEMRALTNIDVAFLCMNLPFTMSVTNAASVVRAFRPSVVYPYHYRNSDNSLSDLQDFKRRVGQDQGVEVRLRGWY